MSKASTARRNRDRGKDNERELARRLGGRRMGTMGAEDVSTKMFSVEAKSRVRFSGTAFMEQAIRNCPEDRVPIVVVHIYNQRRDNDLVIIRIKDFEMLMGKEERDEEQED